MDNWEIHAHDGQRFCVLALAENVGLGFQEHEKYTQVDLVFVFEKEERDILGKSAHGKIVIMKTIEHRKTPTTKERKRATKRVGREMVAELEACVRMVSESLRKGHDHVSGNL